MKKLGIALLVILVLIGAGVFYLLSNLNSIVKTAIETYGSKATQASVHLDKVDLKLKEGEGTLEGLHVGNPAGFTTPEAFDLGAISIKLDTNSVTGSGPIVIREIAINGPTVVYEHTQSGSNLQTLQKNVTSYAGASKSAAPAQPASETPGGKERKVIIDELTIRDGQIAITDSMLPGATLQAKLPAIHLQDIGKAKGGATPAEIADAVMGALTAAASQVASAEIQKQLTGLATEKAKGALGDKLKGLFGD